MNDFIFSEGNYPVRIQLATAEKVFHSLETAAQSADVHPNMVLYYCRLGLLGPSRTQPSPEITFDDDAVYELRRIEHYRRHLGVNRQALPLVVGLLREVERLQAELRFHRSL